MNAIFNILKSPLYILSFYIFTLCWGCQKEKQKPNVIIIQADDLGWDDLGSHNNKYIETPNLDQLASQSVQFERFYVNPVCAPSRASLLTGRHFLKTGVSHVHGGKDFINLNEVIIAETFKKSGYATGIWGKWHSGTTTGYYPWERGFDEAYMAKLYQHRNTKGLFNGAEVKHSRWANEVIIDYAIHFIDQNKKQPFFAYLSMLTCHTPLDAPQEITQKYLDKGLSENLSILYAMIDQMDQNIGRLFKALDSLQLNENTIILFMSDNGPAINSNILTDEDRAIRYTSKLKGHKGNIWENGVKSPLFLKWEQHIIPGKTKGLTDITDIYPTLVDLIGMDYLQKQLPLDGVSFKELLADNNALRKEKATYNYSHFGWQPTDLPYSPLGTHNEYLPITPEMKKNMTIWDQALSISNEKYKFLLNAFPYNETPKQINNSILIDILNDPFEDFNVKDSFPEIAHSMQQQLIEWFEEVKLSESFNHPVFIIDSGSISSDLFFKGSCEIKGNLKNTALYLTNWTSENDFAQYQIDVKTPGKFQLSLDYKYLGKNEYIFEIGTSGKKRTTLTLKNSELPFPINLDLTKNDTTLYIKLLSIENLDSDNLLEMYKIQFIPK